jgi:hypothetical protein
MHRIANIPFLLPIVVSHMEASSCHATSGLVCCAVQHHDAVCAETSTHITIRLSDHFIDLTQQGMPTWRFLVLFQLPSIRSSHDIP